MVSLEGGFHRCYACAEEVAVSATPSSEVVPDSPPVTAEEVRSQLANLLASDGFANSARLSKFLQVTVDKALAGQADSLKEFALGHDVFDRGPDYDPRLDSIVRVEAMRLRRKLAKYYEDAGSTDPVLILYQPGSYAPRFERRRQLEPPTEATAHDLDPDTVAVLPFVNLSSDPEQEIFCHGTTEEIIIELASVPGLRVLGLTTAFVLRDCKEGLMAMSQRLGVGTLVEGSVRKSGEQLRIGARTVDVATGQTLWSRSFERAVDDIFAIQDEIAQEVAAALQASDKPVAAIPVGGAGVDAYTLYLRGKETWDEGVPERCRAAIEYFRQSAAFAPEFALAQSGLAYVYQWMALWGWVAPLEARRESQRAAEEALRIDSHSADSQVAWATHLLRFEWDWKGAAAALDKALEFNPGFGLAYSVKANCSIAQSRFEDGRRFYERAVQLDPLSYRTNGAMGVIHWLLGAYDEAERWFRVSRSLKPDSLLNQFFLSRMYLSMGLWERSLEESLMMNRQSYLLLGATGAAYAHAGNRAKARETLGYLNGQAESVYVDPLAIAAVQMGLQEVDAVFDSLRRAVSGPSPMAAFLNVDPLFAPLRQDPRFPELIAALHLS
jgi:TolB-like protein